MLNEPIIFEEIVFFKIINCFLMSIYSEGMVIKSTLVSHEGWVSSVDWSPVSEYELVSGSYDCSVKLWDTRRYPVLSVFSTLTVYLKLRSTSVSSM